MDSPSILQSYSPLEKTAIQAAKQRDTDQGLHRHSKRREYLIFCTQKANFLKWALAHSLGFKPLRGSYDGELKPSYIVNVRDKERIKPFVQGEETILLLHDYNARDVPRADLVSVATGERTNLGLFVRASELQALKCANWTFDPMLNAYFICKRI